MLTLAEMTDWISIVAVVATVLAIAGGAAFAYLRARPAALPASLPLFGPLNTADLVKYYPAREPPIAWERVRGWQVNEVPSDWHAPGSIDHLVLMPRLLEFCNGVRGKLALDFNFLVEAIERVDLNAAPPGVAPPGIALLTIYTPSGRTLVLATPQFAQVLQQAVAQAKAFA
jgi:hypothetical protein